MKNLRFSPPWILSIVVHVFIFTALMVFSVASFKHYYPAKVHHVTLIKDMPAFKKATETAVAKTVSAPKKEIVRPAQKPKEKTIKKNIYSAKKTAPKPVQEKERQSLRDKIKKELASAEAKPAETASNKASAVIEPDNFPYTWYDGLIMNKISAEWEQPSAALLQKDSLFAVISFKIMKDGTIAELELKKKSGYQPLDSSVMSAVSGSVPFPPLPDEFAEGFRIVNIRFELTK
ncbi:MAG: cell envelope integrity protein TolA [Candidatus Aureabacteria bacterium]|nr:cell envelope integrity protein TolA [Candidatus Auribacterota bacterium]